MKRSAENSVSEDLPRVPLKLQSTIATILDQNPGSAMQLQPVYITNGDRSPTLTSSWIFVSITLLVGSMKTEVSSEVPSSILQCGVEMK